MKNPVILVFILILICFHYDESSPKRQKLSHKTTEVVGKVHSTAENGILRILLDTGASATIILMDAIQGYKAPVLKDKTTTWNTKKKFELIIG